MKYKNTFRYALIGALFGLCFPVIATIVDTLHHDLPLTLENFARVQADNPLLWIINTAPLFLGFFAGLAGNRQDRLALEYQNLESEIFIRQKAFNEIEKLKNNLDYEVLKRTQALETSTEVSHRLSTILDQDQLVREVVEQVQAAFGYYHTHIYLYDDAKETLVMVGGTGTAGRLLLEHGHTVAKSQGLVGRAGDTNLPILAADVSQSEIWLPNPLLPDTKAEAAIPIATGANVLGVLDVQDNKSNGLTEVDVELLQSIANQVATTMQNSRAYQNTQKQAARETLMANINQQIRNTTDVESALKVTVREIGRALGKDTSIRLNNQLD